MTVDSDGIFRDAVGALDTGDTQRLQSLLDEQSDAGVAMPLIDLLIAASGVNIDLTGPNILTGPRLNGAPGTAMELIRREDAKR